jgi:hypothetical protein
MMNREQELTAEIAKLEEFKLKRRGPDVTKAQNEINKLSRELSTIQGARSQAEDRERMALAAKVKEKEKAGAKAKEVARMDEIAIARAADAKRAEQEAERVAEEKAAEALRATAARESQRIANEAGKERDKLERAKDRAKEAEEKALATLRSVMYGEGPDSGKSGTKFALKIPGVGSILMEFQPEAPDGK